MDDQNKLQIWVKKILFLLLCFIWSLMKAGHRQPCECPSETVIGQFRGHFWTWTVRLILEKHHWIEDFTVLTRNYYSVSSFFFFLFLKLMTCELYFRLQVIGWRNPHPHHSEWRWLVKKEVIPQRLRAATGRAGYCLLVKRFILLFSSEKLDQHVAGLALLTLLKLGDSHNLLWI